MKDLRQCGALKKSCSRKLKTKRRAMKVKLDACERRRVLYDFFWSVDFRSLLVFPFWHLLLVLTSIAQRDAAIAVASKRKIDFAFRDVKLIGSMGICVSYVIDEISWRDLSTIGAELWSSCWSSWCIWLWYELRYHQLCSLISNWFTKRTQRGPQLIRSIGYGSIFSFSLNGVSCFINLIKTFFFAFGIMKKNQQKFHNELFKFKHAAPSFNFILPQNTFHFSWFD